MNNVFACQPQMIRASEIIKSTKMTPDFCSPILYKIRQGASMVSYWLYVAIDTTQNTGKKTSKMVDLIISEVLMLTIAVKCSY